MNSNENITQNSIVWQASQDVWDETTRKKTDVFFYVFLPIITAFFAINFYFGYWVVGGLEAVLLFTGLMTVIFRKKILPTMLSHISVAHITLLTYVFIFFPAVGDTAYLWAIGLPFFTSYLVGSRAAIWWQSSFFVAVTVTGLVLANLDYTLYWPWELAPFLILPYLVMSIFSVFFAKYVERYIYDLKQAKEKLRKNTVALEDSEMRYRTLLQSSMNAVGVHRQGHWLYANPACLQVLGANNFEEIVDVPIINFVHPEYRVMVSEHIDEMVGTKEAIPMVEAQFMRLNGEAFPAEVSVSPIVFDGQESFMITLRDLSELKNHENEQQKLQTQLEHAQRLESLGVLAGGIAHDFNNLLAAIAGNAELLRSEIQHVSAAQPYMRNIDDSCSHAADLCKQMLAYAGKGQYVIDVIELNDLVKSMSRLIRASVSSNVRLGMELDSSLPMIEGDVSQIKQLMLNFIVNSADAIGDKEGRIKISTFTAELDRKKLGLLYNGVNMDEGLYVVIEVKDSGCGMSEALQKKIFDPFVTTKTTGSGLGLSAVLGIVQGHYGGLELKSMVDRGTAFRIFLPSSDFTKTTSINIDTGDTQLWQGSGLVLIVDDDKTVRDVVSAFVERLGFKVILAEDGREGVNMYRQYHSKLQAVLLDMTMPRLGGVDALREMRDINADVPIVMVSGYSETETASLQSGIQPDGFVQKPFRFKDVKKILFQVTS